MSFSDIASHMQHTDKIGTYAVGIGGSALALGGIGLGFRKLSNDWAAEGLCGDKIRVSRREPGDPRQDQGAIFYS